jgi:hypothetical protein
VREMFQEKKQWKESQDKALSMMLAKLSDFLKRGEAARLIKSAEIMPRWKAHDSAETPSLARAYVPLADHCFGGRD